MSIDLNADLDLEVMHYDQSQQVRSLAIIMGNEDFDVELFPNTKLFSLDGNGDQKADYTDGFRKMMREPWVRDMNDNVKKAITRDDLRSVLENDENHDVIPHLRNENIREAISDSMIRHILEDDKNHDVILNLINRNIIKAMEHNELRLLLGDDKNHDIIAHLSDDNIKKAIQDDDIKSVLKDEGKHNTVAKLTDNKLAKALGYQEITNLLVKDKLEGMLTAHDNNEQVFGITAMSKVDKAAIDAKLQEGSSTTP